jgi:hypothetical protein
MQDKLKEATKPQTNNVSNSAATLHAAIGRFASFADAQKAVKALRQAGFSDDTISVRQVRLADQDSGDPQAATTPNTIVGVQAEGERAAEAWSILQNAPA